MEIAFFKRNNYKKCNCIFIKELDKEMENFNYVQLIFLYNQIHHHENQRGIEYGRRNKY